LRKKVVHVAYSPPTIANIKHYIPITSIFSLRFQVFGNAETQDNRDVQD